MLIGVPILYGKVGKGVEFFPNVEPDQGVVLVHARGNLSLAEKDRLVRAVEARILPMKELSSVYARSGDMGQRLAATSPRTSSARSSSSSSTGRSAGRPAVIMNDIRDRTADIPGIKVEVHGARGRPADRQADPGAALQRLSRTRCARRRSQVAGELAKSPEIRDLDNGLPMPGIDWRLEIDKAEAAKYGIGVGSVGSVVQLVTNGLKITDYRPQTSDKPVDIILRVPEDRRTLTQLDELRVQTPAGAVPIGNFIKRVPAQSTGIIHRVDGKRVITVTANVADGDADGGRAGGDQEGARQRPTSRAW